MYCTKLIDWYYEEEVRIILLPHLLKDNRYFSFDPQALDSIIFGAQISKQSKEKILKIIQSMNYTPKIYEASLNEESYSLDFEEINK